MTVMIAPSFLFRPLWMDGRGVMKVEMNGVATFLILIWLITRLLNSSGEYSSASLILESEAKRPATSICLELMPAESIFDHLYNRGGTSSEFRNSLRLDPCSLQKKRLVSLLDSFRWPAYMRLTRFWLEKTFFMAENAFLSITYPRVYHNRFSRQVRRI